MAMRGWTFAASIIAAAAAFTGGPAAAQSTVVCESQDGAYRECGTPFRGRAVLVETMSGTACIEGRNWGSRRAGAVWVTDGCRARFADASGYRGGDGRGREGGTVRCESDEGRYRECALPGGGRGGATLVRQLSDSACVEGRTWGSRGGTVWVQGGCRGEFAMGGWGRGGGDDRWRGGEGVICASEDQRHTVCRWDARYGRPRLVEQLSEASCREGFSWGYQRGQIWVDRGCRGRFSGR